MITGEEDFLHRTLRSIGVPPLHILRAQNGLEYRFYELTGDLPEALHFRHFERSETEPLRLGERIRLKGEVQIVETSPARPIQGRIRIKDEPEKKPVAVKLAAEKIKVKKSQEDKTQPGQVSEPTSKRIRYTGAPRIKPRLGHGLVKICKL
jgi:hypothetical protein